MTLKAALLLCLAACVLAACRDPAPPVPTAPDAGTAPGAAAGAEVVEIPDADADAVTEAGRPKLRVDTLDHGVFDLAQRRGQWVLVNFWATWCAPCLKEMPELSALDAMREHVEVIGLAYEEIDEAALRAFLDKRPVVYPIAIVDMLEPPAGFDTPPGLPMTYLIGPDGTVSRQFLGPVTAAEVEPAIAADGGPAPAGETPGPEGSAG
jgi:thiol-disulfide isomerase/thioredoxin